MAAELESVPGNADLERPEHTDLDDRHALFVHRCRHGVQSAREPRVRAV